MTSEISQFIEQTKKEFDDWDSRIDEVESRIESAGSNLRSDYYARVDQMRFKLDEAREKLRQLETAAVRDQVRLQQDVTQARDALRELVSVGLSTMQ